MDMRIDGRGSIWSPNGKRVVGHIEQLSPSDYFSELGGPGLGPQQLASINNLHYRGHTLLVVRSNDEQTRR